jgi:hypothetical protein
LRVAGVAQGKAIRWPIRSRFRIENDIGGRHSLLVYRDYHIRP